MIENKTFLVCILFFILLAVGMQDVYAQDNDGDSVPDSTDIDDDNDGILDINEDNGCNGDISYEFYDLSPSGNTVDNIPTSGALATGVINTFDVDFLQNLVDPGDTNDFSIRYTGTIFIDTNDTYTFFTSSDDGSKLFIDGIEVVDNDGAHGVRERSGSIFLTTGFYSIEVLFFERGGGEFLSVEYESTSISKTSLPFTIISSNTVCDFDGDTIPNRLDLDSDNDGISDNVEAQSTLTYLPPSNIDSDLNGLDDAYEVSPGSGEGISLVNTRAGTNFDFSNLDSDSDGLSDEIEAGHTLLNIDSDVDGLDDAIDTTNTPLPGGLPDYSDPNGTINNPSSLPNIQNISNPEVDYRDNSIDSDNDGISDDVDVDDDNDGILDTNEFIGCVGEVNYEFYDLSPSGNTVDNIPTSGALATGLINTFDVDFLQNLVDPGDTDNFSIRYTGIILIDTDDTYTFFTSSDDGSKLFIDGIEVVDNDGAHGVRERSGSIFLTTGFYSIEVLFFERGGGEFLSVEYESTSISKTSLPFTILYPTSECDSDGDLIPNRLDLDSDNDGCNDSNEAYGLLSVDSDGDGIFGTGTPSINPDGSVVGAPYTIPVDSNSNSIADFIEFSGGVITISSQPVDVITCLGCSASFSVTTTGNTFQWQFFDGTDWVNLTNTAPYSGTDTNTLAITNADAGLNGLRYRVIVSNGGTICAVLSEEVTLTLRVTSVITNRRITKRINRN